MAIDDEGDMGVALLEPDAAERPASVSICHGTIARGGRVWQWRQPSPLSDQKLRLFNVHIDPHGPLDNQHQQTEAVLELAERTRWAGSDSRRLQYAVKTKGDRDQKTSGVAWLHDSFSDEDSNLAGRGRTQISRGLDFVKGVRVNRWGVARPLNVSDHWPIWAEMSLPIAD